MERAKYSSNVNNKNNILILNLDRYIFTFIMIFYATLETNLVGKLGNHGAQIVLFLEEGYTSNLVGSHPHEFRKKANPPVPSTSLD